MNVNANVHMDTFILSWLLLGCVFTNGSSMKLELNVSLLPNNYNKPFKLGKLSSNLELFQLSKNV